MKKISLILVDDHSVVREGIKLILNEIDHIEVIGEAADSEELFTILEKDVPDILIQDIFLPTLSGIEITKIVKEKYPSVKIIIFSGYTDNTIIFEALEAGAIGILPKNAEKKELLNAIEKVSKNEEYLGDFIKNMIVKSYLRKAEIGSKYITPKNITLSEREIEIIKLSAEGFSSKEIGRQLFISPRTVESHKKNIMQKLNYTSTIDLVKYAIKNKFIEI